MSALFQLLTYDNMDQTTRTSMFGCKYSSSLGSSYESANMPKYDDLCGKNTVGVGWIAPMFFVIFVILCGFVMMSSLVGLMISSMEQLTDIRNAEIEIWKDVDEIAEAYEITRPSVELSLKLFETIDKEVKCHLTYRDLQSLLRIAGVVEDQEQLQYYLKVDRDGSGQIEFPEFIELLAIVGFSLDKTALARKKKEIDASLSTYNKGSLPLDAIEKVMRLPEALVSLSVEKARNVGSHLESSFERGNNVAPMSRPNRNAIERKSYRIQSKKMDKSRLMASYCVENEGSSFSGELKSIREAINRRYSQDANDNKMRSNLRHSKDAGNSVSQFEEMPYEMEILSKPKQLIVNYSKAYPKVVAATDLFVQE